MKPLPVFRRITAAALALSAAWLVVTAGLPHQHPDGSSTTDPAHSCSITKIHRSFSPSLPSTPVLALDAVAVVGRFIRPGQPPQRLVVSSSTAPRAPPLAS